MLTRKTLGLCSLALAASLIFSGLQAQVLTHNKSTMVSVVPGTFVSVIGDLRISDGGMIYNEDSVFITGDIENVSGGYGFDPASVGIVKLVGDIQRIHGNSTTGFYDLDLLGTGPKEGRVDIEVHNDLFLYDMQFDMDSNMLFAVNSALDAITVESGFISASSGGGLKRSTDQMADYYFPLGTIGMLRPVVVTPEENSLNEYMAAMVPTDPSNNGFNRNSKESSICALNDDFYYEVDRPMGGSPADLHFLFDQAADGGQNGIAQWRGLDWRDVDNVGLNQLAVNVPVSAAALDVATANDFDRFDFVPFDLDVTVGQLASAYSLDADTILSGTPITLGEPINTTAESNGATFSWSPASFLSCTNCARPVARPSSTIEYVVNVVSPLGCTLNDTVRIVVLSKPGIVTNPDDLCPDIPTGITPNGDGANDAWILDCLSAYPDHTLVIVNRWGDEVFGPVTGYQNDFNGLWKGKELPEGTYYYLLEVRDGSSSNVLDGPLTILR